MFNSDFFKANRRRLRSFFPDEYLFVFTANGQIQRSGSTTYPFRQDSSFWYLTGVDEPDVTLVIEDDEEYLMFPRRSQTFEVFNGSITARKLSESSGVKKVFENSQGLKKLRGAVQKHKKVVTVLPVESYVVNGGFYSNPARRRLVSSIKRASAIEIVDARQALEEMRMIKQAPEIEAIKQSAEVTMQTFKTVVDKLPILRTEAEISRLMAAEFILRGAEGPAYDTIVASGVHACTLHYLPQESELSKKELVLIDAGAELSHYASDVTRTFSLSKPSSRQLQIYSAVMSIRDFALKQIRPGLSLREYEIANRKYVSEILGDLELSGNELNQYYPHSTSHFLGLDVHDAGNYELPLGEGVVLTVEPGIYIEEEGIGIRVEDNILVTADGYMNLTEGLPRELV